MNKHKAVLFDYDGTLVDSNILILHSWQHVAHHYMGDKNFDVEYLIKGFGRPLFDCMEETLRDYGIDADTDEAVRIYKAYQLAHPLEFAGLYPKIKKMLMGLKRKGVVVGIVTSRNTLTTVNGLKKLGVYDYFDQIVSCDDTDIHKPDPTPALLCCKKLGVDPEDAIMVGDSKHDIACGNNAGCDTAFVKWSFCTKAEELEGDSKPDYILLRATDLWKYI